MCVVGGIGGREESYLFLSTKGRSLTFYPTEMGEQP